MSEYRNFLSKFFPYADYSEEFNNIYLRICENNIISEIFKRFVNKEDYSIFFLDIYLSKFNKLLLYLPLKDQDSIDICIRGSVENLLRFYYCIFEKEQLNKVKKINYRNLKDNLLNQDFFNNVENKQCLNILLSKYGEYSKSVHIENVNKASEIDYLETIILKGEVEYSILDRDILKILNVHLILTSKLLDIKYKEFNTADRLRLNNKLRGGRLNKIIELLS